MGAVALDCGELLDLLHEVWLAAGEVLALEVPLLEPDITHTDEVLEYAEAGMLGHDNIVCLDLGVLLDGISLGGVCRCVFLRGQQTDEQLY